MLFRSVELSHKYPWIYQAAAIPPQDIDACSFSDFSSALKEVHKNFPLHAIGETGLDFVPTSPPIEKQIEALRLHCALAEELNLPLIFHCRNSFLALLECFDLYKIQQRCLVHCFTGTIEEAKECTQRGWLVSASGIVTFKKSTLLREVFSQIPLDSIVIETDAPYLTPESRRGKVNEPSYIRETALCMATCKNISVETVAATTSANMQKFLFG